jgi:hypothetical protein
MSEERHYLAYHTPSRMGYGGSRVNVHVLQTRKEAQAREAVRLGATVWLIGREEGDSRTYWFGWLKAKAWRRAPSPEAGFTAELHGDMMTSRLRPMDDGEPVLLEGRAWLPAALRVLGNGAFGLQPLYDTEVIAGLEELRRTAPRMVSGSPRARQKKPVSEG